MADRCTYLPLIGIALADAQADAKRAAELAARLELYRADRAYIEPAS